MEQQQSGLAQLHKRIADGSGAPFEQGLGMVLVQADPGRVLFTASALTPHTNIYGYVHGGWTSGLLDAASGAAIQSVLEPGETYTTLSLQLNYLRQVQRGTEVEIEARIIRAGARIATAEARILLAGEVAAIGISTCMRLKPTQDTRKASAG